MRERKRVELEARVAAEAAAGNPDYDPWNGEVPCGVEPRAKVQYRQLSVEEEAAEDAARRARGLREAELERNSVAGEGVRLMGKRFVILRVFAGVCVNEIVGGRGRLLVILTPPHLLRRAGR